MMGNINIKINKETRQVNLSKSVIGNDGENLQEKLVFSFNSFVNGTARLELLKQGEAASYIMLTKVGETYELPIKSVITKAGRLNMQLVITEGTDDEEIPVFKSNQFYMIVNSSINAEIEEDDEYPQWIDVANTKLNEIDEALDDLQDKLDSGYFKGDKGDKGDRGETGLPGSAGRDGAIQYTAGENITIENNVISATGSDPYSPTNKLNADYVDDSTSQNKFFSGNYNDLTNKPDLTSYETTTNKVSSIDSSSTTTQYASAKAVWDLLSGIGGQNITMAKYPSTQSNQFDFRGKKAGIYLFNFYADLGTDYYYFWYYLTASTKLTTMPLGLILLKDMPDTIDITQFNPNETIAISFELYNDQLQWRHFRRYGSNNSIEQKIVYLGQTLLTNQNSNQLIYGTKRFYTIPQYNSVNAIPTSNGQLTSKKYVDDSINNALGTIETTLGGI